MSKLSSEEQVAYLQSLKDEAKLLGMSVPGNIKAETLAKKIQKFKEDKEADKAPKKVEKVKAKSKKKEDSALVRVIVTCHDPLYSNREGVVVGGGNSLTGPIQKYVKFGEPWHVPRVILSTMREDTYTLHYKARDKNNRNRVITRNKQVPKYTIQVLTELSEKELKTLAKQQALHEGKDE